MKILARKVAIEAGIGPKATANLLKWLETEYYPSDYKTTLPFKWENKISKKKEVNGVVCISGKLKVIPPKHTQKKYLINMDM